MTKRKLGWLWFTLALGGFGVPSCGGDDDTTGAGGSADGGPDSKGAGGSGAAGGAGGAGAAGAGGGSGGSGGSQDAGLDARVPCGAATCNPNGNNRYCNPAGPDGPRCQACLTDEHCANNPQGRLFCDVAAGSCRSCVTDAHCAPPNRCIAGTFNNTCQLRCASDADCATATGNRRACNLTTMMCVECQTNDHCAGNAGGAVCVGNSCEECGADTDCAMPGLPACINNNCEACRDNTQCAEPTPICVTRGANTCRECGADADCAGRPGGAACVTNTCRQCSGTVPCPAGNTCTMNTCVPLPEGGTPDASDGSSADAQVDAIEGGSSDSGEAGAPEGGQTDTPDGAEAGPTNDGLSEDAAADAGDG
jgi:hypothetical protein